MSEEEPVVTRRFHIPAIWIVPITAAALGLWMLYYNVTHQGPKIVIQFRTAQDVEAGKTRIKARSVDVGLVESVVLSEDLEHVEITAQLEPTARELLKEDSQFWVVRARVNTQGVTGLGTILSGGYIELAPGQSDKSAFEFIGLEEPPITAAGAPGVHFLLVSQRAGSVNTGDPVLHRGFTVGRIESARFDLESDRMQYDVFVQAPYDGLVRTNSRFWNASGIEITASTAGVRVGMGSLQSLLLGGVEFDVQAGYEKSDPIADGTRFTLFPNHAAAQENPFVEALEAVARFDQSVKGLSPGAAVEFRGMPVGRVVRIMLNELILQGPEGQDQSIPVLIRIEPGRLYLPDDPSGSERLRNVLSTAVANQLFATLELDNLLTGSLVVALDFYRKETAGEIGDFAGYPTIPTLSTGLTQLEQKVVGILDQIQAMPLEEIGKSTDAALVQLAATMTTAEATLRRLEATLADEDTAALPRDIKDTLAELRQTIGGYAEDSAFYEHLDQSLLELNRTLKSLEKMAQTIEDQPSSIIFSSPRKSDPEPRGQR